MRRKGGWLLRQIKPGFHMIATIALIAAITWKPLSSDHSDNDRLDRTFYISAIVVASIALERFHMIAMIAAIAEVFFFS